MLKSFLTCEDGAVTIDWVALTSGILLVGITLIYALYGTGVASLSGTVNDTLVDVSSTVDTGTPPGPGAFE